MAIDLTGWENLINGSTESGVGSHGNKVTLILDSGTLVFKFIPLGGAEKNAFFLSGFTPSSIHEYAVYFRDSTYGEKLLSPFIDGASFPNLKEYTVSSDAGTVYISFYRRLKNKIPTVTLTSPTNNQTIKQGTDINFQWSGSDPDGDPLTYTLQVGTSAGASNIYNASVGSATSKKGISTSWAVGLYYWRVVANDGKGGVTTSAEGTFGIAQGNLVTLTKANSVALDTYVDETVPTATNGSNTVLLVGTGIAANRRVRALLKFDLGLIPSDAIINSATLKLHQAQGSVGTVADFHRVTSGWDSNATWNTKPGYDNQVYASMTSNGVTGIKEIDIKTLIQEWVNGVHPNHGVLIKGADEVTLNKTLTFGSFESSNASQQPTVTIDYSIPTTGKKQVEYVSRDETFKTGSSNITIGIPVRTQKGDLLIASVNNNASSVPITPPTGWTKLHDTAGSGPRYSLWYKFAGDNETGPTFSCSNSSVNWIASILAYRNVKAVREMFYATSISGNTLRPPNATTAYDNTIALLINVLGDYAAHATPPLSFKEVVDYGWSDVQITLADSFKYMYKNKSLQSSEMGTTFSVTGSGDSRVIFLEPISNNPPSVILTSPANNQTLSEGNTMTVQGSVTDTDANDPVTIYLQINNGPILAVDSKVSDGATAIPFAKTLTYKNKRVYSGTTDLVGVDLAENTDQNLKVWAEDKKQGKSTEVIRKFRVIWNRPPTISGENGDLGILEISPTVSYNITDPEGNGFTVIEKLNGVQLRSFAGVAGREEKLEIPSDAWLKLEPGVLHTLTIEATDSQGATSVRTYTLTRFEDEIQFEIETPWTTDAAAKRVLLTLDMNIPPGAILIAEACNNAFDTAPTWEDISFHARYGRGYVFLNTQKTAAKWGVSIRVKIEKGTASEPIEIKGFGGAFD